jgi:hypothetical protein
MKDALMKIYAYQKLTKEIENIRREVFIFENQNHNEMIYQVWHGLKGDNDILETQLTKRWTEIGFQGLNLNEKVFKNFEKN